MLIKRLVNLLKVIIGLFILYVSVKFIFFSISRSQDIAGMSSVQCWLGWLIGSAVVFLIELFRVIRGREATFKGGGSLPEEIREAVASWKHSFVQMLSRKETDPEAKVPEPRVPFFSDHGCLPIGALILSLVILGFVLVVFGGK